MNVKVRQAFNRLEVILHFMSDRMSIHNLKVIENTLEKQDEDIKNLIEGSRLKNIAFEELKGENNILKQEKKAFNIIKIKEIDISLLLHCKDANEYNYRLKLVAIYPFATSQIIRTISQSEFEIVKEAVKNYGQ